MSDNGGKEGGWMLNVDPQRDQEVTGEVWYIGESHSGAGSCLHILYNKNKCYDRESSLERKKENESEHNMPNYKVQDHWTRLIVEDYN